MSPRVTDQIFHIAFATDWEDAQRSGAYAQSTVGRTLEEEGFIHCSYADQVAGVANFAYSDVTDPLVLLTIDPARVGPYIQVDNGFPHIYGPLDVDAVIEVRDFHV